jgi:hypothetical protein
MGGIFSLDVNEITEGRKLATVSTRKVVGRTEEATQISEIEQGRSFWNVDALHLDFTA